MVKGIGHGNEEDMRGLERIIGEIDTLRPISYIGDKIIELTCNPNSSLTELVDVIKYDQSMTANLLRICNSS